MDVTSADLYVNTKANKAGQRFIVAHADGADDDYIGKNYGEEDAGARYA